MSPNQLTLIKDTVVRVLEGGAFLFVDEIALEATPSPGSNWEQLGVSIDYEGPHLGEIRFWVPKSLANSVAVNMLGLSEDTVVSEQQELDAIKEMLNMIAGNFLTDAFGVEDVYHLGIPFSLLPQDIEVSTNSPDHLWVSAEDHPVLVSIHSR